MRWKKPATVRPETICQMPHHAVMTSMPPWGGKPAKMEVPSRSTRPSPEFWMPVSMVRVRRSFFGTLKAEPTP